ncbi:MAG: Hsp70 family protein, partial [Mycobacteriaceae bacterium]|nr:Hsp70 family protein [Mycobacteriaceae bacterium]
MSDSLGLSVGMTNLVAARVGSQPVTRRAVLTLFPHRAPEVGVPSENANLNEAGLVMTGFVERVGDPVPLVAGDGSTHRADRLLVEALDAMVYTTGNDSPPSEVAIAVPAHWGPAVLGALRGVLRTKPNLSPNGVPATLISDATAALSALQDDPGLPASGVVALLDFGGTGTSITLADAASNFEPIGETVRVTEFSGDQIDQAILTHVLAGIASAGGIDPASTAAVGALNRLRDESRQAKERLSAETATVIPAELPGFRSDIRLTRAELEGLIGGAFGSVVTALQESLDRNRVPPANLAAVATVGGGASIPFVTQQVSDQIRVPVVTTQQPQLKTSAGAALLAGRGPAADAPTGMAAAADMPTGMGPAAWAAGAAGLAAGESAADGAQSATFRALAWSEDDTGGSEMVPYAGADYEYEAGAAGGRPQMDFLPEETEAIEEPLPWYRRPQLIFAAAAALLVLAAGGLAYTLTSKSSPLNPNRTTTSAPSSVAPAPGANTPAAPQTVTVTGGDGRQTVVTQTPPPPSPSPPGSSTTTTETTTATTTTTTTA